MATVKENELAAGTVTTGDFFRSVDAAGNSEKTPHASVAWAISQTTGLQTALDAKMALSALKSQYGYINASGQIIGANRYKGTFTVIADLDALFNGDYLIDNAGAWVGSAIGTAIKVSAWDDSTSAVARTQAIQEVMTTKGCYYRVSLDGSTWSNFRYVGGAYDTQSYTRAEILDLISPTPLLTAGTLYMITDHGNDDGLIIQAATSSAFLSDGIRLGLVPAHYVAGTYDGDVWIGVWRLSIGDGGVSAGDHAVFMGRVWYNNTGAIGTVDAGDEWSLDSTNWTLATVQDDSHYTPEVFGVTYDIRAAEATGYISKQWDGRGNIFGSVAAPEAGFLIEYNDWGNEFIYGNVLKTCRNNDATSSYKIYNNNGDGDIHSNEMCNIYENILTDENNNIRFNSDADIYKNVLGGLADIEYIETNSTVAYNTINGDVKGDSTQTCEMTFMYNVVNYGGLVKDFVTASITYSEINGSVDGDASSSTITMVRSYIGADSTYQVLENNVSLNIADSRIESGAYIYSNASVVLSYCHIGHYCVMTGNDIVLTNCVMENGSQYSNKDHDGFSLSGKTIKWADTAAVTAASQAALSLTHGAYVAEMHYATGTFTVATGASYVAMTIVTGMAQTVTRSNCITWDTTDKLFNIPKEGWYKFYWNSSCFCPTNMVNLEIKLMRLRGGSQTEVDGAKVIKTYPVTDQYIPSSFSYSFYALASDSYYVRFRQSDGSTITLTVGNMALLIEEDN